MATFPTSRQEIIDHYIKLFSYEANGEDNLKLSIECADEQTAKLLCSYFPHTIYQDGKIYFTAFSQSAQFGLDYLLRVEEVDRFFATLIELECLYRRYETIISLAQTVIKLKTNSLERFIPKFGSLTAIRNWLKADSSEAIISLADSLDEDVTYFMLPALGYSNLYYVFDLHHPMDGRVMGCSNIVYTSYGYEDNYRLIINYRGLQFNFSEESLKEISLIIHGKEIV